MLALYKRYIFANTLSLYMTHRERPGATALQYYIPGAPLCDWFLTLNYDANVIVYMEPGQDVAIHVLGNLTGIMHTIMYNYDVIDT